MRDAILSAARQLVTTDGVDALNMRAVARQIGYSVAALYEYFPAKEDILTCLYFEGAEGLRGRMQHALDALPAEATARQQLAALGHAYRAYAHDQVELFRITFGRPAIHAKRPTEMADADNAFDILVGVTRRGVERGEFAPLSPLVLAIAAWTCVHGFVMLELDGHLVREECPPTDLAPPSIDDVFAATLHLAMNGMLRRTDTERDGAADDRHGTTEVWLTT